jgi:signal transduction histidine kinase
MVHVRSFASWFARLWGPTASPRASLVVGVTFVVAALAESLARAAVGDLDPESALIVALLALATTVPLAAPGGAGAAFTIWSAAILSLAGFHTLTVAGLLAVLATLLHWTRTDQRPFGRLLPIAACAGLPFLALALAGSAATSSEAALVTVLLAALAPAAALGGIAARAQQEALENRAARQVIADTLVEHTVLGERARIARELHDVVAHHISMVAVQAESARLAVPGMPADGARRLSAIGDTARAALVEMRRLLGVLREDARLHVAERRPQPGLDQLTELIDQARSASAASTRLILRGTPIAVDPSVEVVAYRIVQEALTNARRHAPGAAVDVELTYGGDELGLRVRDNGPGPPPDGSNGGGPNGDSSNGGGPNGGGPVDRPLAGGHGVVGMRERAAAVGGTVSTGSAAGGGYLVEAVLPVKIEDAP